MMTHGISTSEPTRLSVNDDIFKSISIEIENNRGSSIPQPILIIGQYGCGKTTLLKRLRDSDACKGRPVTWIDGRTLFSSEDIISRVDRRNDTIVFIDDMDFYLTRCNYDEQFRLRGFLYNEGAPMMIATANKVLPALAEYNAPFFEGLKNVHIPPVTHYNITALFQEQDLGRVNSLMSLLPPTIKSVETVRNIIRLNDNPDNDTDALLSLYGEKYVGLYQSLPTNSQHILNAFVSDDCGLSLPDIRDRIGVTTNVLTAYLKTLVKLGIMTVDRSLKRRNIYHIKDPLFRKWLSKIA